MEIVKAPAAADFLAAVPHLVGFAPEDSLVLVVFRGSRTCGALRLDLPRSTSTTALKRVATTAMGMVCTVPAVDGVVPVVYTGAGLVDGRPPHAELVGILLRRAQFCGLAVRDALCVGADGWGSYPEYRRGRGSWRDLAEIAGSPVGRRVAALRGAALESPAERAALPEPAEEDVRRAAREYERIDALLRRAGEADLERLEEEFGELCDPVVLAERALRWSDERPGGAQGERPGGRTGAALDATRAALLARFALGPPARDAILMTWAWGPVFGRFSQELSERHRAGEPLDPDEPGAAALGGLGMPRPDPERIARGIALLRRVAPLAPADARPPLLTMLAWLHWARGHGSVAGILVDRVRELDPRYGLAELLAMLLQADRLPEWACDDSPTPRAARTGLAE